MRLDKMASCPPKYVHVHHMSTIRKVDKWRVMKTYFLN